MTGTWNKLGRRMISQPALSIFAPLLDIIYPPLCLLCEERMSAGEQLVCRFCWHALPRIPQPLVSSLSFGLSPHADFDFSLAIFEYAEPVQELIHHLKYQNWHRLVRLFGEELAQEIKRQGFDEKVDLLVPVPLHPARLRERGYNQSELLARAIATHVHLPVRNLIRRIRYTKQQAKFDHYQRMQNVKDAFSLRKNATVDGKTVAIVDDVVTTGHTINECAKVLNKAGAREIIAISIVRIEQPKNS